MPRGKITRAQARSAKFEVAEFRRKRREKPKPGLDFKKDSDYDTNIRLSGLDAKAVAGISSGFFLKRVAAERISSGPRCCGRVERD
jgi:hypothetical protein